MLVCVQCAQKRCIIFLCKSHICCGFRFLPGVQSMAGQCVFLGFFAHFYGTDGTWTHFHHSLQSCWGLLCSKTKTPALATVVNLGTGQLKREVSSPKCGVIKDNPAFQSNLHSGHCHLVTLERDLLCMFWFPLPPPFAGFDYNGEHPQTIYALWSGYLHFKTFSNRYFIFPRDIMC